MACSKPSPAARGRARFLSLHLDRLAAGCERLQDHARRRRRDPRARSSSGRVSDRFSLIKLIVTRGQAVARGYGWSGQETATRVLLRYRAGRRKMQRRIAEGVRVGVASMRLGENPALAGMKHLNRLEQVLARAEVPQLRRRPSCCCSAAPGDWLRAR